MKLTTKRALILVISLLASGLAALWAKSTYLDEPRMITAEFKPIDGVQAERARFVVDSVFGGYLTPAERRGLTSATISIATVPMDGNPLGGTIIRAESPELCVSNSCLVTLNRNVKSSETYEPIYFTYAEKVEAVNNPSHPSRPTFILNKDTGRPYYSILEWDDNGHGLDYQLRAVKSAP